MKLREPPGRSSPSGRFRLALLLATVAAFLLVPAAQATVSKFALTIETTGTGEGTVECAIGSGSFKLCATEYSKGTELTLRAKAKAGSEFVEWGGECAAFGEAKECELRIEEETTVEAIFNLQPRLTIETAGGTGEGTVECAIGSGSFGSCATEYSKGTELTLREKAKAGSEFVEWGGECAAFGELEGCELRIEVDTAVEAIFNLQPRLTIETTGTGSGTVKCEINGGPAEACATSYPNGTSVELKATANPGSSFAGFSAGTGSAASCSTSPCTFTIGANSAVTATFNTIPPAETCATNPSLCPPPPAETCATNPSLCPPGAGTLTVAGTAPVKAGKAALKLSCSGGACKGTLELTAKVKQGAKTKSMVIGRASFSLAAGASKTLEVKLSGAAKRELGKGRTLKAKVTGTGVTSSTVKLKPRKK